MVIACPKCKSKYQLRDGVKLERVRCKKCQEIIDVKSSVVPAKPASEMKAQAPDVPAKPPSEMKTPAPPPDKSAGKPSEAKTQASGAPAAPPESAHDAVTIQSADVIDKDAHDAGGKAPAEEESGAGDLVGKTLGGYEILKKLGEGGMGAVYLARQVSLDRNVALKVLPANLAANKTFITRFTREALSVAKLNHNNIIGIYDVGRDRGTYYFAMELVVGRTLQDIIDEEGQMDVDRAVGYVIQAARGLEYAHRKHIIHRDIKPDNIMINDEGVAKVADLGLAKQMEDEQLAVTMSGVGMGTPYYMSPEQASDAKNVDQRADVYSLGCTLYHLITGRIPFEGTSAYEIITKHVNEPITLPEQYNADISGELSGVVAKILEKKKEDRYQSMVEVIGALEEYLGVNYAKAGFQPSEDQITILQGHGSKVAAIQNDRLGKTVLLGVCAAVVIFALLSLKWRFLVVGVVAYIVLAPALYFLLFGSQRKTYVYQRARRFLFGNRISDWLVIAVVAVAALALMMMLGWLWRIVTAALLAAVTAGAYYWAVKRPLLARQDGIIEDVKKFIRELRKKGIPEEQLHLFSCQHGGEYGELICEEMHGYESVLKARAGRSPEELEKGGAFSALREWVIGRINAAEEKRLREKESPAAPVEEAEVQAPASEGEAAGAAAAPDAAPDSGIEAPSDEAVAAVVEGKKAAGGNPALGALKFSVGGKGRLIAGVVMILLAGLSFRKMMFQESTALTSPNYILFAFALVVSGLARSKALLGCLFLSCVLAGLPWIWKDAPFNADLNLVEGYATTPLLIGAVFFFVLGFAAAFLFKAPRESVEGD